MKTNQTMMLALRGAAACSFFFGLGQQEVPAAPGGIGGTGVTNCVVSCCEANYSWWTDVNTFSAQVPKCTDPTKPNQNLSQALASIYVQATTPGGCKPIPYSTFDEWKWQSCAATCQNSDGT